jgi:hypothetical protein
MIVSCLKFVIVNYYVIKDFIVCDIYHKRVFNLDDINSYVDKIVESPGRIYGELVKYMLNSHKEGDLNKYMKNNLEKLREDKNIISVKGQEQINQIIDVITSDKEFKEKADQIVNIYKQIMDDAGSGKMARVVSCIAADSAHNQYQRPKTSPSSKAEYVLGVNVSGALVGAVIGSNAGGTEGAILGALIGGTASSVTT